MKKYRSVELLDELQSDVRHLMVIANHLRSEDPGVLVEQPSPGKWTVVQALEHLNSYNRYYLPAIQRSLEQDKPAVTNFKPGWLGDYFTRMMRPGEDGTIRNKMKAPKNHRPPALLDPVPVLNAFIDGQYSLLDLLEKAKTKDINAIRTPISISKFVRFKVGDTFRFLIAHEQRHFLQIQRTLEAVKKTYFYPLTA
jgi:hypothetical protein